MFKVGQKVWCAMHGEGEVAKILTNKTEFPVEVRLGGLPEYYTLDGRFQMYAAKTLFPYPVEIVKKIVKPSINWDHVDSKFNYLAQDDDDACWLYENKPNITVGGWDNSSGACTPAGCLITLNPGTCNWKDSLVKRPD